MAVAQKIDLSHLDRYVAGDRALRDEVLAIYTSQAEGWVHILDPRLEDGVWRDAAHALKGASRGVGAWEVGDICERAEHMVGPDGDIEGRRRVVETLRIAVSATISDIRRLRS